MNDFQIRLEIGTPERIRVPDQEEVQVYSGKDIEAWLMVPVGDAYKEYPNHIKDTPEGWHEHRKEQAEILGGDPPSHPLEPSFSDTEYWRLRYRIDGGDIQHVHAKTESWDRREFLKAVKDDLLMHIMDEYGEPYQVFVGRLSEEVSA